ncbi:MAG: hypothetical protein ACLPNY_20800 [Roseiarcus sp.]
MFSVNENLDFQIFPKIFLAESWNFRSLRAKKFGKRVFRIWRPPFLATARWAGGIKKQSTTIPHFQKENVAVDRKCLRRLVARPAARRRQANPGRRGPGNRSANRLAIGATPSERARVEALRTGVRAPGSSPNGGCAVPMAGFDRLTQVKARPRRGAHPVRWGGANPWGTIAVAGLNPARSSRGMPVFPSRGAAGESAVLASLRFPYAGRPNREWIPYALLTQERAGQYGDASPWLI